MSRPISALVRRFNWIGLVGAAVLIGLWEMLIDLGPFHFKFVPAPSAIARHLPTLFTDTNFAGALKHTLRITLEGWVLASLIGIVVGLAIGSSPLLWRWSMAVVDTLRALPVIAFVPVAILIFGLSSKMELVLVTYSAVWPTLVSVADGVLNVHPLMSDVGRTLHLGRVKRITSITLPATSAPMIVGLRLSLTTALVLAIVAEMVGNPAGLGYELILQQQSIQPELMFGYVLIIGALGVLLNAIFVGALTLAAPGVMRETRS